MEERAYLWAIAAWRWHKIETRDNDICVAWQNYRIFRGLIIELEITKQELSYILIKNCCSGVEKE